MPARLPVREGRKEIAENRKPPAKRTTDRIRLIAGATALAVASMIALQQRAHAEAATPPHVPSAIQVPGGSKPFLAGHAVGTQNYVCLPSAAGFAWTLFTPQAALFDDGNSPVTTHFFSPNPFENGKVRATWQHVRDTSTVWGESVVPSSDPAFVAPGAIPWLRIKVVGRDGPTHGHALTATTYVQRLNTVGGIAPSTGCAQSTDVGKQAFVPYTADYYFYSGGGSDAGS